MAGDQTEFPGTGPEPMVPAPPLAARMRPRTLDEFVGQDHVTSEGSVIRQAVRAGVLPSMILWGPPGTGKTTLAMLLAEQTHSVFEPISAVSAGVADLRAVVKRAEARRDAGQSTLLFIDEIHRFTRTQQDAILPHVESGLVILFGATTENPGHQVNAALLSRARVIRLLPLDHAGLETIVDRALNDPDRGLGMLAIGLERAAREHLIASAGGDARIALNGLEIAAAAAAGRGDAIITVADIEGALQQRALLYDRAGDEHYSVISAFIKSIRGTDPDAAVYWLARLLEAGEDPRFVARRLVISASEDIGLADPSALTLALSAQRVVDSIGMPEAHYALAEATLYLAAAPKSNSSGRAYSAAVEEIGRTRALPVPPHLRNATTRVDRQEGFARDYRDPHEFPDAIVEQDYLPPELRGRRYYDPSDHGREGQIRARLAEVRRRLEKRRPPS